MEVGKERGRGDTTQVVADIIGWLERKVTTYVAIKNLFTDP